MIDDDLIDAVAARLDLRRPNREALETVVYETARHFEDEGKPPPFECVVSSATGVGKTYIIAGIIEYFAAATGSRNFAIVAPGTTIRNKTIDNFSVGHPKSLLPAMEVDPVLVTADTFASPSTRSAMEDESRVKLYVFTVQSLVKPKSKAGKRTHEFQEGLGGAFYEHLQQADDLIVLADEHHCYYGKAFSDAVRDLAPWLLVGLTATPHSRTPDDSIVFRYPLSAAIADRYVKTPVIVGRKDDRSDPETKLLDGLSLLRVKAAAAADYAAEHGLPTVNPVMLVVTQNIDEANEYAALLGSSTFDGGEWSDKVLTVHSDAADEALDVLDGVEDLSSPVRVIIAVGMLKEGWDVKNVYVIASMRASVSSILTEQTLGRGMRLPWGRYTDVEMLDTLEVVAHERYEDLLKKAQSLKEAFVDHRTRAVLRTTETGERKVERETTEVSPDVITTGEVGEAPPDPYTGGGGARIADMDQRKEEAKSLEGFLHTYAPRQDVPPIQVPQLRTTSPKVDFSLTHITELDAFRKLGQQIGANPDGELRRMRVVAKVVLGPDGIRRTVLQTAPAEDRVESAASLFPLKDSRERLEDAVLSADIVPARNHERERRALQPILDEFVGGLGPDAERLLSSYGERAAARLVRLVTDEARRCAPPPQYQETVSLCRLGRPRESKREETADRFGRFSKQKSYKGWSKSLYPGEWFDSSPERAVANAVDASDEVALWVKLRRGELPIVWRHDGREYNPDFVIVETDGSHYLVEVKSDKDASTEDVARKREAAQRWVNAVNADEQVEARWSYLLLSETDISQAKESWVAMKRLGM